MRESGILLADAGVVQRLVYKFSKLRTRVRFPAPAPIKLLGYTKQEAE